MNNKVAKILGLIPDSLYLRLRYYMHTKKKLNLRNPKRFNEKLQWLKLYNRRPEYTVMVDKYLVRDYIKEKIGEQYLIPLLGVWDNVDDIDFDALPDKFVIKCNHNPGDGMYICTDKSKMDIEKVKAGLKRGLEQDYYLCDREWPYKNVPHKIVAEEFMIDNKTEELMDYKFFCFNGKPEIILVCLERFSKDGLKENFYDVNWNLLNLKRPSHPNSKKQVEKPKKFDEMIDIAEKLSKGMPFARIDLYDINDEIFFGEITFFPATGTQGFEPDEIDFKLGEKIVLPDKKIR